MKFCTCLAIVTLNVSTAFAGMPSADRVFESIRGNGAFVVTDSVQVAIDAPTPPLGTAVMRRISLDKSKIVFDDGDSIVYAFSGEDAILDPKTGSPYAGTIRFIGVDAPEITHSPVGILYDQPSGLGAAAFTESLIRHGGKVELISSGSFDPFGRPLCHIILDDKNLAVSLIEAGLAYEAISIYGDYGMPELARAISAAWEKRSPLNQALQAGDEPSFINPARWRKINLDWNLRISKERWESMSQAERAAVVAEARVRAEAREAALAGQGAQ